MEKYNLIELIEIEKLQQIQDAFAAATHVASTIVDTNGTPITSPSNHSRVCSIVRSSPKGLENCIRSGKILGQRAAKSLSPFHQKCFSCGFVDAAAPIIVNGHHIANWLVGQYYIGDANESSIAAYSREIDVSEEEMVTALREMPKISKERFEKILHFLWIIANEISNMGYQNLQQKVQTEELLKVKFQLEKHKNELEKMVATRTAALVKMNTTLNKEIDLKNAIQQKQSRLIAAIEHAAETIAITDAEGTIIYVNPAFESISGYGREELIGKNHRIMKSGVHDADFYAEFWQTITSGQVWNGRFRNRKKNGTLYDEESTVSSVKDESGNIINYVAVKRDITRELELERQLLQANKLESIGTLAAGIAHEINTPIQYVHDNTQFLQESLEEYKNYKKHLQALVMAAESQSAFPEMVREIRQLEEDIDLEFLDGETERAVEVALEGLDRIAAIVSAMKEFANPGGSGKDLEDINTIITNTVTVSSSEWKNNAEMTMALDPTLPSIPLLSGKFKQVLLNLIMNASQAIAEKHQDASAEKGNITISTSQEEDMICIRVRDTGIGVEKQDTEKIFDPFFTTKPVGKGTGQGLAIAYSVIVEGHGGTIDVVSEHGNGAEFIIRLPISPP